MSNADVELWTCQTCKTADTRTRKTPHDQQKNDNDKGATKEPSLNDVMASIESLSSKLSNVLERLGKLERTAETQMLKHNDTLFKLEEQHTKKL